MWRLTCRLLFAAVLVAGALLPSQSAEGATDTWNSSGTTADWATTANWASSVPGSADTALFNSTSDTTAITLTTLGTPTVFNLSSLSFDTAAANYTIGTTAGDAFDLTSGGTIQILGTLSATNAVETINAPLVIEGAGATYTFANNSANGTGAGAGTLNFGGGITGGNAGATVLTLSGSNTNANTISGIIANGTATTLGITKSGTGTWFLTNANTFTGGTTVSQGTLKATNVSAMGGTAGNGTVTLGDANTGANNIVMEFSVGSSATVASNFVVTNQGSGTVTLGTYGGSVFTAFSGTMNLGRSVTLNDGTGGRTSFTGQISGNVGTITITGSRVTLDNAANNFVGNIVVNPGSILQANSTTSIPSTSSVTDNGAFNLTNGGTHPIDALSGSGTVSINTGGNQTLSIGNNGGGGTFSGVMSNQDSSDVLSLTKNGAGTEILSNANTYTGNTKVTAGTLTLSNNLALTEQRDRHHRGRRHHLEQHHHTDLRRPRRQHEPGICDHDRIQRCDGPYPESAIRRHR